LSICWTIPARSNLKLQLSFQS